jgi:UDP-3-O-[3-hydroxymyristoyl] glucosamine N-acyltransferase
MSYISEYCYKRGYVIGGRVIIQSGVVIGGDGFGFASADGKIRKIPQKS